MWFPRSVLESTWPWMRGLGRIIHATIPGPFCNDTILSVSDYSGGHHNSQITAYSFLYFDPRLSRDWPRISREVRSEHLHDARRMAFKSLNDFQRANALPYFLSAADSLCGILCTVAVDKSYTWMATTPDTVGMWKLRRPLHARWTPSTFEQMMRVTLLWSFILSYLARPYQNVTWITDQDQIAANDDRLSDLLEIAAKISGSFNRWPMRELAINTTAIDNGDRGFEDLVAIPDLVAGAFAEVASRWEIDKAHDHRIPHNHAIDTLSPKSCLITDWHSYKGGLLRKVAVAIRKIPNGKMLIHRIESTGELLEQEES